MARATSSLSTTDESLAASSVIMPQAAQVDDAPRVVLPPRLATNPSEPTLSVTIPSGPPSETDSFESSISLVDAPESPISEELEAYYREVREHAVVVAPPAIVLRPVHEGDYVMLYDSSSSESD